MNIQLLIDAIVRQTTVLVAELATAGGARAPLAHLANQVFIDLAGELERQGVSRKVSADMFGLALRSYQRKVARLRESSTIRGQSLWEAVLDFLTARSVATRAEVLSHFHADPEDLVSGVLHDLAESGVIYSSGRGIGTLYRAISTDDLSRIARDDDASVDAMVWTIVYRNGPLEKEAIVEQSHLSLDLLDRVLERLEQAGRIDVDRTRAAPAYSSAELVIPEARKVAGKPPSSTSSRRSCARSCRSSGNHPRIRPCGWSVAAPTRSWCGPVIPTTTRPPPSSRLSGVARATCGLASTSTTLRTEFPAATRTSSRITDSR
jgi:hypothetical protein